MSIVSVFHNLKAIRPSRTLLLNVVRKTSLNQQQLSGAKVLMSTNLPSLPVPELASSLEELKLSAGSFAVSQEEFTNFCTIVNDFAKTTGPKLHSLLVEKSKKTENWLSDDWWLNKAYLEGRDTVIVWSNPALICPKIDVPAGQNNSINYVSNLILGALDFREFLIQGGNPEGSVTDVCMKQYQRIFGTTRIPGRVVDKIKFGQLDNSSDHLAVVISRKGNFYRLELPKNSTREELSQFVKESVEQILKNSSKEQKVGVLTALPRTKWANSFEKLDQNSVNSIIDCEFVVNIDHVTNTEDFKKDWNQSISRQVLIGDSANVGNRWFDKTIQLIIVLNKDASQVYGSGICYEHTPAEAGTVVKLMEHAMKYLAKQSAVPQPSKKTLSSQFKFNQLPLVDNVVSNELVEATTFHEELSRSLDLQVLEFQEFGKDMIKSFKVSPDSFIQVAINWAYYKYHKLTVACYESASTRKFANGRTECIRSVTPEFYQFSKNPNLASLKTAIEAHKNVVKRAMNGQGIDRLLLGLNAAASEVKDGSWKWSDAPSNLLTPEDNDLLQKLYHHELFIRSKYFFISTSQVATIFPNAFMIYGPLVNEGYGCCYNPSKNAITFGISAFNNWAEEPSTSDAVKFKESLSEALIEMKNMMSCSSKL